MRIFKKNPDGKLSWNATWCVAVGGMVGGGIFPVLGVVVFLAGSLAWLSFVFAGLIALATAYSYVYLAVHYGEAGGAFRFLRKMNRPGPAGSLSWVPAEGDLPQAAGHLNRRSVPDISIIFLGAVAALMAVIGSLSGLVEVASLTFLITFATVNVIAALQLPRGRWISVAGAACHGAAVHEASQDGPRGFGGSVHFNFAGCAFASSPHGGERIIGKGS